MMRKWYYENIPDFQADSLDVGVSAVVAASKQNHG
jgi:hypothetical protein